ncbi:MAG TPA: M20/M25/M40 family metallo-hydrolase [Bryobacteraceae bacterium]|nr:M20/M25/M40 family metallo-hydrolase [Bryobacteraceae bacterium]
MIRWALASVATALFAGTLALNDQEISSRIIDAAMADTAGYEKLAYLCDRIGNRPAGSPNMDKAVLWAADQMRVDGLVNIVTQRVKVPHWIRGNESASLLEPVNRPLTILGLGGSVATPRGGFTAEVVIVHSFEELESLGRAAVKGKIVLFNVPWDGYARTVVYRQHGASRAAKLGAVGALVRSVTPNSLQSPHTGAMEYAGDARRIPAAAITVEDALLIQRLKDIGNQRVVVHLEMESHNQPDAESANVFADLPGREKPREVVVIGGHLDSWDVGQGAQDDAAGCITMLQAAAILKHLGLQPRRTIRVVFWTDEEREFSGAIAYRRWVGDNIRNHVAAIEMDEGAEKPIGFGFGSMDDPAPAQARLQEIGRLLEKIGANGIFPGGGGADIAPLMQDGVPGLSIRTSGKRYFEWHHSRADTVDKVDIDDLRRNIAAVAVMAYMLAEMPETLRPHASD